MRTSSHPTPAKTRVSASLPAGICRQAGAQVPNVALFTGLREQVEMLALMRANTVSSPTATASAGWSAPPPLMTWTGWSPTGTVNSSLVDAGFGAALLCTVIAFTDGAQRLGTVYLYKRGSWYPLAPTGEDMRDTAVELQIKSEVEQDLRAI